MDHDNILTESFKKMNLLRNHKQSIHVFNKSIMDESPSDILKLQNRMPYLNEIMRVLLDLGNNRYKNKINFFLLLFIMRRFY